MSEITIRVRDNGPLVVEGKVRLLDAAGVPLSPDSDKPALALCRCGASNNKPFCDGSHRDCGFQSQVRADK